MGSDRIPYAEQDILIFSNVDSDNERKMNDFDKFYAGKTWPLKKRLTKESSNTSIAVGRENTPSEGFIYILYEFGI